MESLKSFFGAGKDGKIPSSTRADESISRSEGRFNQKKSLFYRPGKGAKILDDRAEAKQTHQKMDSVSENSEDDLL